MATLSIGEHLEMSGDVLIVVTWKWYWQVLLRGHICGEISYTALDNNCVS